jgi:hypothetical protein
VSAALHAVVALVRGEGRAAALRSALLAAGVKEALRAIVAERPAELAVDALHAVVVLELGVEPAAAAAAAAAAIAPASAPAAAPAPASAPSPLNSHSPCSRGPGTAPEGPSQTTTNMFGDEPSQADGRVAGDGVDGGHDLAGGGGGREDGGGAQRGRGRVKRQGAGWVAVLGGLLNAAGARTRAQGAVRATELEAAADVELGLAAGLDAASVRRAMGAGPPEEHTRRAAAARHGSAVDATRAFTDALGAAGAVRVTGHNVIFSQSIHAGGEWHGARGLEAIWAEWRRRVCASAADGAAATAAFAAAEAATAAGDCSFRQLAGAWDRRGARFAGEGAGAGADAGAGSPPAWLLPPAQAAALPPPRRRPRSPPPPSSEAEDEEAGPSTRLRRRMGA